MENRVTGWKHFERGAVIGFVTALIVVGILALQEWMG